MPHASRSGSSRLLQTGCPGNAENSSDITRAPVNEQYHHQQANTALQAPARSSLHSNAEDLLLPTASGGNCDLMSQAHMLTGQARAAPPAPAPSSGEGRQLLPGARSKSTCHGGMNLPPIKSASAATKPADPRLARRALKAALTPAKRTHEAVSRASNLEMDRKTDSFGRNKRSRRSKHPGQKTHVLRPAASPHKHTASPDAPARAINQAQASEQIMRRLGRVPIGAGSTPSPSGSPFSSSMAQHGVDQTLHFQRWEMKDGFAGGDISLDGRNSWQTCAVASKASGGHRPSALPVQLAWQQLTQGHAQASNLLHSQPASPDGQEQSMPEAMRIPGLAPSPINTQASRSLQPCNAPGRATPVPPGNPQKCITGAETPAADRQSNPVPLPLVLTAPSLVCSITTSAQQQDGLARKPSAAPRQMSSVLQPGEGKSSYLQPPSWRLFLQPSTSLLSQTFSESAPGTLQQKGPGRSGQQGISQQKSASVFGCQQLAAPSQVASQQKGLHSQAHQDLHHQAPFHLQPPQESSPMAASALICTPVQQPGHNQEMMDHKAACMPALTSAIQSPKQMPFNGPAPRSLPQRCLPLATKSSPSHPLAAAALLGHLQDRVTQACVALPPLPLPAPTLPSISGQNPGPQCIRMLQDLTTNHMSSHAMHVSLQPSLLQPYGPCAPILLNSPALPRISFQQAHPISMPQNGASRLQHLSSQQLPGSFVGQQGPHQYSLLLPPRPEPCFPLPTTKFTVTTPDQQWQSAGAFQRRASIPDAASSQQQTNLPLHSADTSQPRMPVARAPVFNCSEQRIHYPGSVHDAASMPPHASATTTQFVDRRLGNPSSVQDAAETSMHQQIEYDSRAQQGRHNQHLHDLPVPLTSCSPNPGAHRAVYSPCAPTIFTCLHANFSRTNPVAIECQLGRCKSMRAVVTSWSRKRASSLSRQTMSQDETALGFASTTASLLFLAES